jgi:hypothetical protein
MGDLDSPDLRRWQQENIDFEPNHNLASDESQKSDQQEIQIFDSIKMSMDLEVLNYYSVYSAM